MKKNIVLFIYVIVSVNFAMASSFDIRILSDMLFEGTMRGIENNFTYHTLSKQNNIASPNYIHVYLPNYIASPIDTNQKYQVRLYKFHYTVIRTSDNLIIDGNGSKGTIAQKSGTNVCELLATDNSLYLNSFDNLYYSDFSRRLQSMKYNNDLVLFYTIIETYSIKTSRFRIGRSGVNYNNNGFGEIFRNLLIYGDFSAEKINAMAEEFSNMINYYARNIFDNSKNINNITPDEFKQIMFEIFTQIKHRMKLTGKFNPLVDTPHLLRVFDYPDNEIEENNKIIVEKYNTYIKEYLLKKTINNLYLSFNKNIHDYYNFIHNSSDGFNYGFSYNKERNTNNKIFNIIGTYEKNLNKILSLGVGLNLAKYDFNNLNIVSNGMLYLKINNDMLSNDIGLHYGKLFNPGNNKNDPVNFKFNNKVYGYFIRFYKYLNINTNFLEKIEISSSYFKTFYNIKNIVSRDLVSNKISKYNDINFNDNYFYNTISFYLPHFRMNNGLINLLFGMKNIVYLDTNYIRKDDKCKNSFFIQNNVKIKNSNLYIDLGTNVKNVKDLSINIMFTIDL